MDGKHKIKAFTLSETLVVLLLTLIVVGMAFAALQLIQQHMSGIEENYGRSTKFNLLQQSLWYDFNENDGVWYDPTKEELTFINGLGETIYEINENEIVKAKDTFPLQISEKSFFFNGLEQPEGEIDAINIELSKEYGSKRLFVFKNNAATTYMNQ